MDRISALMDGELGEHDAKLEIARLKDDPQRRERWESFHVIGDAIRGERVLSAGFSASLSQRLAAEPTVLAPRAMARPGRRYATYALSAAASLCAVALVAWVAVDPNGLHVQIAGTPPPPVVATPVQVSAPLASVSSDGRMNEYLLAHQGFSPSTAIQGLAPYIRSVSATRAEGR